MSQGAARTMPFGKYKGWQLERLPLDYMDWLANKRTDRVTGEHIPLTGWLGEEIHRLLREAGLGIPDEPDMRPPAPGYGPPRQQTSQPATQPDLPGF